MHWLGRVESWSVTGPDPDVPQSSWRGGLCERTGPSLMEQQVSAGGISQKEKVKKETISDCLGNSSVAATPLSCALTLSHLPIATAAAVLPRQQRQSTHTCIRGCRAERA